MNYFLNKDDDGIPREDGRPRLSPIQACTMEVISGSGGNFDTFNRLHVDIRVGGDTLKKYLKIQILYSRTYTYTDRKY